MTRNKKHVVKALVTVTYTREELSRMPPEDQAEVAHRTLSYVVDQLTEAGFEHDLVATAANDIGLEMLRLDGTPIRVIRLRSPKADKQ